MLTSRDFEHAIEGTKYIKNIKEWVYRMNPMCQEKFKSYVKTPSSSHLSLACQHRDLEAIKFLVEELGCPVDRISLSCTNRYPFNIACEFRDLETVQYLYSKGSFPSYKIRHTSLWHAARNSKHPEIVYYLIDTLKVPINIGKNVHREDIFTQVCIHQDLPVVKYLVSKGINTNTSKYILHTVFAHSKLEVICYLLSLGFSINKKDNLGRTPLDCISTNPHIQETNKIDFMKNHSKLIEHSIYKSTFRYKLNDCIQKTLYYKRVLSKIY